MTSTPFAWTHGKTDVSFDGAVLSIGAKRFPLDQIERLSRGVSVSTAQGSWNRLDASIGVAAAGESAFVNFAGDAGTERWGPWRPQWDELDALVSSEIQPRLLSRVIEQVRSGTAAELCSYGPKGRGRWIVGPDALKARKPFAKPIAWSSIADVTRSPRGDLEIHVAEPSGKTKQRATIETGFWDGWAMAPVIAHFLRP